ncbi:MAG: hypothetical protein M1608_00785, partial [Candidatus Omnitrophica bacterium]|nr:hypothetical protein [Candidatus Omnitrophota bacterium]
EDSRHSKPFDSVASVVRRLLCFEAELEENPLLTRLFLGANAQDQGHQDRQEQPADHQSLALPLHHFHQVGVQQEGNGDNGHRQHVTGYNAMIMCRTPMHHKLILSWLPETIPADLLQAAASLHNINSPFLMQVNT